ncbi:MAG: hypothetical protein ABL994_23660 [Verrucomicrobiales bacterium]
MSIYKYKDPYIMTREEAEADWLAWEAEFSKGKTTWHGNDVEGHLEMLCDRLRILRWQDFLDGERKEGAK